MRVLSYIFAIAMVSLSACGAHDRDDRRDSELMRLATWMSGTFDSSAQAAADTDYLDIHLGMRRIWPARRDGIWLYVEQSLTKALDKPYRQRVYRLHRLRGSLFESQMFSLPDAEAAIGKYNDPAWFAAFNPTALTQLSGCGVILRRVADGTFAGGTIANQCKNTFRGAAYATSEVRVTRDAIVSWDRGYDADRSVLWGAIKGGYIFKKSTSFKP